MDCYYVTDGVYVFVNGLLKDINVQNLLTIFAHFPDPYDPCFCLIYITDAICREDDLEILAKYHCLIIVLNKSVIS